MLKNELKQQGEFLFRWRSYLPLVLIPAALIAASEANHFESMFGGTLEQVWELFCIFVSVIGLAVRCTTVGFTPKGTSGRNASRQRAESLNTTGMYSIVRNPLYLGNYLIMLGFVLLPGAWWFVLLASVCFALYYERIIYTEEEFLEQKFGRAYTEWAASTPLFLPAFNRWKTPDLTFSFRNVLRREYSAFYLIFIVFTLFEFACDILGDRETIAEWIRDDAVWIAFLAVGTVAYLCLRTLKRNTLLLDVYGR